MRFISTVVAITLFVLAALTTSADARTEAPHAPASASWHGRAIAAPGPRPQRVRAVWPPGWSAGAVGRGTGYARAGGSRRVRDVQRHLTRLGYRPGPVDGLFGPRTEAAARWFQYKHGLRSTGRIDRLTLTVLRARSDHRPLPQKPRPTADTNTEPAPAPPATTTTPEPEANGGVSIIPFVLIALALAVGVLVGALLPRRRTKTPVLGYVARGGSDEVAATAPALEDACARRDWSLIRIVQEPDDAGGRLTERPGLLHALEEIEAGTAEGLVVTGLRDFTTRFADLAALMQWLTDANGFLAAVDDDLDTSTPDGSATVAAVIDIASWRRQPFGGHPHLRPELEPRIAALQDRGLPATAIADALNLAGVPAPNDHGGWDQGDVAAASRRAHAARSP
jgi:peptidoglycan hydrolase-like protein with peptidoglycan-binding domain